MGWIKTLPNFQIKMYDLEKNALVFNQINNSFQVTLFYSFYKIGTSLLCIF